MKTWLKRIGLGLLGLLVLVGAGGGIFVYTQVAAYDASMEKVYDVPVPQVTISTEAPVLARGEHLARSITGCGLNDCHGKDFGGGHVTTAGPIGQMVASNLTQIIPAYSDGELARLIRHGIKKDGRTVRFMSVEEFNWMTDADLMAIVSFLRTVPKVDRSPEATDIKAFGKVLDRQGMLPIDVARKIKHDRIEVGPMPAATAEYGAWVARLCSGCHGEHFSGGHMPGTPPDFPTPLNITFHETGLKGWTFEDFVQVTNTGVRKNGKKLDPFMPIEAIQNMDDTEKHALFAYLQTLPPVAFGGR